MVLRPAVLDRHILTLDVAGFLQALEKPNGDVRGVISRLGVQEPNHWHTRLLRPRHHRPRRRAPGFLQGLKEAGYVEGQNVAIEYRWAENQLDRLPALAADLVRRRVAVIVTAGSTDAALAAKVATMTIPIVFATGGDPVSLGLVASLNRPGANVTGIANLGGELAPKQLQLLRELIPNAAVFGVLADPAFPPTPSIIANLQAAARTLGLQLIVVNAGTDGDLEPAFACWPPLTN